jgi:hypothetical protein
MTELEGCNAWVFVRHGNAAMASPKGAFIRAVNRETSWRRSDAIAWRLAPHDQEGIRRPCR